MKKILILLTIAITLFSSCKDPFDLEDNKKTLDKNKSLDFVEIFNSNHIYSNNFNQRQTIVIKSQDELEDFLSKMTNNVIPKPDFPTTDFNDKMLLGIVFTSQPSGSNKLRITAVNMVEGVIEVSSELYIPGIGTDDIGYPVVFVEIDKYNENVKFLETKIIKQSVLNLEDLYGKNWELTKIIKPDGSIINPNSYRSAETNWTLVDLEPFTIKFNKDSHLEGKSNCNDYMAQYTIKGDSLSINNFTNTEVACPLSDLYISILANYAIKIDYSNPEKLIITSKLNNGDIYTFHYNFYVPEEIYKLDGTKWKFVAWSTDGGVSFSNGSYNDKNGDKIEIASKQFTLQFNSDKISGIADCENFESAYTINYDNKSLNINKMVMKTDCGFNDAYYVMLANSKYFNYKIQKPTNQLILYSQDKSLAMLFQPVNKVKTNQFDLKLDTEYILEGYGHYYDEYSVNFKGSFSEQKIIFNQNKSISGNCECNNISGTFNIKSSAGDIDLDISLLTENACQNEIDPDFKYKFTTFLNKATNYFTSSDGRLIHLYFESNDPEELNYIFFFRK